jgi:RHS repeat-associated protein
MSHFARMREWILVAALFVASGTPAVASASRETQVIQQGTALAAFTGTDQGQGNTGLRLTSMGRWHDDRGVQRFTIWRLRNAGATPRSIRLDAPGTSFAIALAIPPSADLFLRSPVVGGPATHRLFEGSAQVDVKAAGDAAWADPTPVERAPGANRPPVILSVPDPIAEVGQAYRYPVLAFDPDNDPLALAAPVAPSGYRFLAAGGRFEFRATTAQVGSHPVRIDADDGRGGLAQQSYALRVLPDFCGLYPIALPDAALAGLAPPATVNGLPRGTGPGNFSWLTWGGSPSAPVLAASLAPPGDSDTYVDPDEPSDRQPDIGDWTQGATGSMNADAVRTAMTTLQQREIVVPTWRDTRGSGNRMDYRIQRFARIRLTAHDLTGQGTLSFAFLGWHDCYADAPVARDQVLQTRHATPVTFVLAGDDPDGDALSFQVVEPPRHGVLSGTAPNLTYTPSAGHAGTDRLLFVANDGARASEPGVVAITTLPPSNREPVAVGQTVATDEDLPLAITLQGSDPDGDALSFRIARAPARGTLGGTPPNLVYQPTANLAGDDEFFFRVSDGSLESSSARVVVQVRAVDDPPTASPLAISTDEDTPVAVRLRGEDVDSPVLTYAIVAPPAHGALEGTPPDLVYRPAADFSGTDRFTYRVRDATSDSPPTAVTIAVNPKNDAPRITTTPVVAGTIGAEYRYDVDATDVDGDVLAYVLVRAPAGMAIDRDSGLIRWTPTASEPYPVEVIVDAVDPGGLFDKQIFLLSATPANRPPAFQTTPPAEARVGSAYDYDADASDPDGDPLSYALRDAPAGMAVGAATGAITWTPQPDQVGTRTATLLARDGRGGEATQRLVIDVRAANRPPVITSTAPTTATIGAAYSYDVDATDPDGDTLAYALGSAPAGMTINAGTGLVAWTPADAQVGANSVTVRVTDGRGGQAVQTVTVTVAQANRPPVITSTAPATAVSGAAYSYDVDATDPDGDTLGYALEAGPAGMTIRAVDGFIEWTPRTDQVGPAPVRVAVTDGRGGATAQSFLVTVGAPVANRPPRITSQPPLTAIEGQPYRYDVDAVDPDPGDTIRYQLGTAPSGAAIDASSGMLGWTPGRAVAGGLELSNPLCRRPPQPTRSRLLADLKWQWRDGAVASTPVVGPLRDTNGDGRVDRVDAPVVVFVAGPQSGNRARHLVAVDGATGATLWSVSPAGAVPAPTTVPAIADIDGDGRPEIVVGVNFASASAQIGIFDANGALVRVSPRIARTSSVYDISAVAVADLEGDGRAELIYHQGVFRSDGSLRWSSLRPGSALARPVVVDLDMNGSAEVVLGRDVFDADGNLLFSLEEPTPQVAIGNFDADPYPEIAAVQNGDGTTGNPQVRLYEHDGRKIWGPILTRGARGGLPIVADFDGDGHADIGVFGHVYYAALDRFGRQIWIATISDDSTGSNGSVAVDLDGDERYEVVTNDHDLLRVLDGVSGVLRLAIPSESATYAESVVVADANADGHLDIIVPSDRSGSIGLRMFSDAYTGWNSGPKIFNQYNYTVDNVTPDGGVPRQPGRWWLTHNTFRALPPDNGMPDLGVFQLESLTTDGVRTVRVRVTNRGLAASTATTVGFSRRAVDGSDVPIASLPVPALEPLASVVLQHALASDVALGDQLTAVVDSGNVVSECIETNNATTAMVFAVRAVDGPGARDQQEFTVWTRPVNAAPRITTTALPSGTSDVAYAATVTAEDGNVGDVIRFTLVSPPAGMTINPLTGRIDFFPTAAQATTHPVTVRATDLSGQSSEVRLSLVIVPGVVNRPPVVVSTPVRTATPASAYHYDIDATDPDGDAIGFRLMLGPVGMTLAADTGLLQWTAPTSLVGQQTYVHVDVVDARGRSTSHVFQIGVEPAFLAPVIDPQYETTSNSSTYAGRPGVRDGNLFDDHLWRFLKAPPSASIDTDSGAVNWRTVEIRAVRGLHSRGLWPDDRCRVPGPSVADVNGDLYWAAAASRPSHPAVAALADSDGNGRIDSADRPSVVIAESAGRVRALDPLSGSDQWTSLSGTWVSADVAPAIADVDLDGTPEVLVYSGQTASVATVVALRPDGSVKWRASATPAATTMSDGAIVVADILPSPGLEVILGPSVYSSTGTRLVLVPVSGPIQTPVPVDLDRDGAIELAYGVQVFTATGSLVRSSNVPWPFVVAAMFTAVGNFDADPALEVVVTAGGAFRRSGEAVVLDDDGTLLWRSPTFARAPGDPVVADFAGGPEPEIYLPYAGVLLDSRGTVRWATSNVDDTPANNSSATAADLNGDGALEILELAWGGFTVRDAHYGTRHRYVDFYASIGLPPASAYPLPVDLDGDGSAEVLSVGERGIRAYRDSRHPWTPAPRDAPQQMRSQAQQLGAITLVDPEGRAHRIAQAAAPVRLGMPDLWARGPRLSTDGDTAIVSATIVNRGLRDLAEPFVVAFRGGSGPQASTLLGSVTVPSIRVREEVIVSVPVGSRQSVPPWLVLSLDDENRISECDEQNNKVDAGGFWVEVQDLAALTDQDFFSVGFQYGFTYPRFRFPAPPRGREGEGFRHDLVVELSEPSNSYAYRLVSAPDGLRLDPRTGRVEWLPRVGQAGTHRVTVRGSGVDGQANDVSFEVVVDPGAVNSAPSFTSAPPNSFVPLSAVIYNADAIDADGEALTFAIDFAPAGATIDPTTGVFRWVPPDATPQRAQIRVSDPRRAFAVQTLILLPGGLSNRPPLIESTPPALAEVGQALAYHVVATDPDGDPLAYSLATGPGGMAVDAASGRLSWTPLASQVAVHPVAVEVSDGRGGLATQTFSLTVRPANRPPLIGSTAPLTAAAGSAYRYQATASDPDSDALSWTLRTAPDGMSVVAQTGLVQWTPTVGQVGVEGVVLEVVDGRGGTDTQSFSVEVRNANQRPTISSTPATNGKVDREYRYSPIAIDPDGDPVTWRLAAGPSGMTLDAASGLIRFTPRSTGRFDVALRAADAGGYAEQAWSIDVVAASTPLSAEVSIAPSFVAPGGEVTITVGVTGAGGPVAMAATLTPPGSVLPLDADGVTVLTAPASFGCRTLAVAIDDGVDRVTRSARFCVGDPTDTAAPSVTLHAPADGAEVTSPAEVRATVSDPNLAEWLLAVRPANSPDAEPTVIARGNAAVADAQIGRFDPTLLINGQYALILRATDASGNVGSDSVVLRVTGDMKVGHFSLTFEDVSIPVAGIPIRVTRTYDTRQRGESLDFGHGWSVDYQNVRVRESAKPGLSWRNFQPVPGPFGQWCTRSNGDRVVTVTLPDGAVESFRAKAEPECTALVPEGNVHLVFEPIDGTDSRLEQTDYGLLRIATTAGSGVYNLVDPGSPTEPVDPDSYRLTTPEGLVYELDQGFGIRRVIEPGGQSLSYSSSGVVHSTGVGVRFVRDGRGRIRDMVLPDGAVLTYTYTAGGDLESVSDASDEVTRYTYGLAAFPHYLTSIVDPRNIAVLRNEYDEDGRLLATIDADGHRIEYTHDIDGRREQVRDRRGNLTTYVYDDEGRVLAETNALGETTRRTYDADGNILTETDPLGHAMAYTYDPRGNRLSETNALGETVTSTYDARNNLLTQFDALGRATIRSTYRPNSNFLAEMQDATGAVTRFAYDLGLGSGQTGELTAMTDAAGAITRHELDGQNRGWRVAEVDALGHRTAYTHDAQGRVLSQTQTRVVDGSTQSLVTRYTLDAEGRVTRTEHPDGTATTTAYDANDKPVRECDALDRCTVTAYDARGNVARVTHPDGTYEETTYDANGNTIGQRDRDGRATRMAYDEANRLVETIHPDDTPADDTDNPRTSKDYDAAGRLLAVTDELGRRTAYRYDAAGRRTHVIEPAVDGSTAITETRYDAAGQRTALIDARGRTTRFEYDAAGRLTTTVHPDAGPDDGNDANNPRTRITFDALGRKTAETDPDGRRTAYAYDALGRLTSVVLAAGTPSATTTTYAYDEQGNRTAQTDAEGRATRFTFDRMGRESSRTLPLGQIERKTWTPAGEPASVTDFNGRTTRWTHDGVGRVAGIDYPSDPDVSFTYTASGQRATAVDGHGTVTQAFDARDRLVRRTDAAGRVIEYTYDAKGNLSSRVTASQSLVYAYDARDRLVSVTATVAGGLPRITRYTYDEVGLRTGMTAADGTTTAYTYDRRNRLVGLVQRTAAAALLFSASYTVDATGLRTNAQESDASGVVRTLAWTYDALKRLTGEAIDHRDDTRDRNSTWTYDRVGNRLTQQVTLGTGTAARTTVTTSTYDANDRLTQESARENGGPAQLTTYTYDAQGNTLRKSAPGGVTEYTWDDAHRLVEQREGGNRTTYRYDADGLRIGRTTFPTTGTPTRTDYLVDPTFAYANVIERFEGEATVGAAAPKLAAVFTFGEGIVGQTTCTPNATSNPHDCPAAQERFLHADGFGSTRFLTNPAGASTDRIDYDAWGNEIGRDGTTAVEHLYRGEQFDPNLGWYYLRARYMDPAQGRFASLDPFAGFSSDPMSLHKYLYAHSDAVNGIDPSGLMTLTEIQTTTNVQALLSVVRTSAGGQVRNAAFRRLGQLAQEQVGKIAKEVLEEVAEEILLDGLVSVIPEGPRTVRYDKDKKRVLDFLVVSGDFVADIEVKYGIPRRGSESMSRLISQVRSMKRGPNASRVLIIMSDNVSNAAVERLKRSVRGGRAGPVEVLNGAGDVTDFFRKFLLR